jgi:hypothetical protein
VGTFCISLSVSGIEPAERGRSPCRSFGRLLILPLVCPATVRELIRALAYPKFRLGEPEIESLLGDLAHTANAERRGDLV